MSQDFGHAFAISMHIPKFVFNLESVSMYKSGPSSDYSNNVYRVTFQNIEIHSLMLGSKIKYFSLTLFYLNLLLSKMDTLKKKSALNPTRVASS